MFIGATLYRTMVTVATTFSKWIWQFFKQCLSYTYHEEQGSIFSSKKYQIFLTLWARESYFLATRSVLWPKICRKSDSVCRLGSGHPSPYPTPLGDFGASMLAPSAPQSSCTPETKSWRRHCSPPLFKVKLRRWICSIHLMK